MSVAILNRSGSLAQRAALVISLAAPAGAACAPTPTIEHSGNWRAAVHRFVEASLKHPAWGLSHFLRDYELEEFLRELRAETAELKSR